MKMAPLLLMIATALFGVYLETISSSPYLAILGALLLVLITYCIFHFREDGYANPVVVFSLMYSGYGLGAFYYSNSDGYFGKFIQFTSIDRTLVEMYMVIALIFAILCYIAFIFGYSTIGAKLSVLKISAKRLDKMIAEYGKYLSLIFILCGFTYWIYVAEVVAGGVVNLLIYFQAFEHMIKDSGISILPYQLYFIGVYFWILSCVIKNERVGVVFWIFVALGCIIDLSTGRISLAFTFLASIILFLYLSYPRLRSLLKFISLSSIFSMFVIYFLRELSNQLFMGVDNVSVEYKDFIKIIIGGGNVSDLQQLVIIFSNFNLNELLLGQTYFDWIRNTIGTYLGFSPSSVGLILHEKFIPSHSGAPTPGAIGEAYANFHILAPVVLFIIGVLFSVIRKISVRSNSKFILLIYSVFLTRFVLLYPKVDSTMLVNFLLVAVPLIFFGMFLYIFPTSAKLPISRP